MNSTLSLSVIIGATVAGTVAAAVGRTVQQVGRIGEATKRAERESQEAIARTATAQERMAQIDGYRRAGQDALAAGRAHRAASEQVGMLAREFDAGKDSTRRQEQALQQVRAGLAGAAAAAKKAGEEERGLTLAQSRLTGDVQAGETALRKAGAARAAAEMQAGTLAERERALTAAMAEGGPATAQQVAALERARGATARAAAALEKRQTAERKVADAVAAGRIPQDQAASAMAEAADATRKATDALEKKRTAEQQAAAAVAAGAAPSREQRRDLDQARAALARATDALEKKRAAERQAMASLVQSRQRLAEQAGALDRASAEARRAAEAMTSLKARETELAAAIAAGNVRSREQAAALENARTATARAAAEAARKRDRVVELRSSLHAAGMDTANLSRHQRTLASDLQRAAQMADKAQAEIDQLGSAAERAGKRMEIGATMQRHALQVGATAAALSMAVKPAIAFESAMADVRKVVDFESPAAFRQMGDDILNLSRRIPMAATGLADITAAAGQAGIARGELLRFTEDAAKMGVAFDMTGKEAGGAMTGLRTIFGLTQDGVVELGDAINHVSNNMDARAADILNIENRVGSMGKMFGLTGQQVAALGATFLALKSPPEVAATGINALLGKLATATTQPKEFQKALRGIGLDAAGMKDAIQKDAMGGLMTFLKAVEGADDKMTVLAELFGAEYADDMAKLVGSLGTFEKALGLVGDKAKYAGSMQKEYEQRADTSGNGIVLMSNSINAAATAIGDALLPMLDKVAVVVAGFADSVAWVAGAAPQLVQGVTAAGAAWMTYRAFTLGASWANTFFAGGIPAVIARLMGQTAATTASAAANSVATTSLWAQARAAAAASFGWLRLGAGMAASSAMMVGGALVRGIGAASAGLWAQARAAAAASFGWVRLGVSMAASSAAMAGGALVGGAARVGGALLSVARVAIPATIGGLRALTVAMMTNPVGLIVGGIALAAGLLISNWDKVGPFFSGLWDGVAAGAARLWEGFKTVFGWTPLGMVINAWQPVATWIGGLWDGITGKVGEAIDWIVGKLSWVGDAVAWFKGEKAPGLPTPANDQPPRVGAAAAARPGAPAPGARPVEVTVASPPAPAAPTPPVPVNDQPARVGATAAGRPAAPAPVVRPLEVTVASPTAPAVPTPPVSVNDQPAHVGGTVAARPAAPAPVVRPLDAAPQRPVPVPAPAPAPSRILEGGPPVQKPIATTAERQAAQTPMPPRADRREEYHLHVHGVSDPRQVADMVLTELQRRQRRAMND